MHKLVELAKSAVENYVKYKKVIPVPDDFPKEYLEKRKGVFVTIMKDKELRGCIGTYLPVHKNIGEEIINNAILAATEDYRFPPISEKELGSLSYTVYILNEPELVKNIDDLDPKKYGVIVTTTPIENIIERKFNGYTIPKLGLLLPDLEGVDTVHQQIRIASMKAGIYPEEKFLIYRFTVEKYQ